MNCLAIKSNFTNCSNEYQIGNFDTKRMWSVRLDERTRKSLLNIQLLLLAVQLLFSLGCLICAGMGLARFVPFVHTLGEGEQLPFVAFLCLSLLLISVTSLGLAAFLPYRSDYLMTFLYQSSALALAVASVLMAIISFVLTSLLHSLFRNNFAKMFNVYYKANSLAYIDELNAIQATFECCGIDQPNATYPYEIWLKLSPHKVPWSCQYSAIDSTLKEMPIHMSDCASAVQSSFNEMVAVPIGVFLLVICLMLVMTAVLGRLLQTTFSRYSKEASLPQESLLNDDLAPVDEAQQQTPQTEPPSLTDQNNVTQMDNSEEIVVIS